MKLPDRLALGLAALFVVVGLVFAIGSWGAYLTDTRIAREGGRSNGTITDKTISHGDDDTSYGLAYEFPLPDGRQQTGQHTIAKADWETRQVGAPLAVSFDPGEPTRNFPVGYGVTSLGMTIYLSVFGAMFAGFAGLFLFAAIKSTPVPEPTEPRRR